MFSISNNGAIWIFVTRDRKFKIDSQWREIARQANGFYIVIIQEFLRDRIDIFEVGHAKRDKLESILVTLFDCFYRSFNNS